jgi:hypothetical protein
MDLITAVRQYLAEMVRIAGPGMKVLLMDKDTVPFFRLSPFHTYISIFRRASFRVFMHNRK